MDQLAETDVDYRCKTQPPTAPAGPLAEDRFVIDTDGDTITCLAGVTVSIRRSSKGDGMAYFGYHCDGYRLRAGRVATSRASPTPAPNRPTPKDHRLPGHLTQS